MLWWLACAGVPARPDVASAFVLAGGTVVGFGPADVEIRDGRITAVGAADPALPRVDVTGKWLAPAFIDSHVHLAFRPDAAGLARGGIAAVVDLAAPAAFLAEDHRPLRVLASGPMITARGGYPTRSWGSDGYGLEVADPEEAVSGVRTLISAGARVIKIPVTADPQLDDATMRAAADEARTQGRKVASHALRDADAARAAAFADVLAHTPVEPLAASTVDAWRDRAVISTLMAFGGSNEAVANLAALRAAGATVLYGTDFGNTKHGGVDPGEIALLQDAGLDGAAILAAGTSVPARYWGLDDLGAIAPGRSASLLVLSRDPLVDPSVLAAPDRVLLDGHDP